MLNIKPKFKNLIPPLSYEEYAELSESILEFGCRDTLVVWNGIIIDGHNRFEICSNNGIPFNTVDMTDDLDTEDDVRQWIIKNQFARRNINMYQRSQLALQLKDMIAAKAKENQLSGLKQFDTVPVNLPERGYRENETREQIAKIAGVSGRTIDKVENLQKEAPEVVKQALNANDVSVNKAYEITKAIKDLPPDVQEDEATRLMQEQRRETFSRIDERYKVANAFFDAISGMARLQPTEEKFAAYMEKYPSNNKDLSYDLDRIISNAEEIKRLHKAFNSIKVVK